MRLRLATVLLALGVSTICGCARGPDTDELRKDVTERLAQAFPDGTLELAEFARRGSQSDTKAPEGETRRIVYFDVGLTLARDFEFGAWDGPGVAGLVSTLGAGPKGIVGITSEGNKEGDELHAHGTAIYRRETDGWVVVSAGGHEPKQAPSYATNTPPAGAAAILDAMRKVIEAVQKDASPVQRKVIEQELTTAHAAIRARLAHVQNGYAIAAGPENGQYLRLVQALASGATARVVPLITRGGEENLRLLRDGRVSLALVQADAALAALEGTGSFAQDGPYSTLRAIGSLYPEPMHVLARADSGLASLADARGRMIAIGEPGSASRTTALRALAAHGIGIEDFQAEELSLRDALVALESRRVDVVMQVIGMPADSVRDAMAAAPLTLLPMAESAVSGLIESGAGYFAFTIPRGAYATQRTDVRTIATAALLLAGSDLSDIEVATVTRFVYEKGRDIAARGSPQGVQVSPKNAQLGLSVPLHTAAAEVLDELR